MLYIGFALLSGLILSWFGFDYIVRIGMEEVFGKSITMTGYYFLFAIFGALKSIAASFNGGNSKLLQTTDNKNKE